MGLNKKLDASQVLLRYLGGQQKRMQSPCDGSVSPFPALFSGFGHTAPSSHRLLQQVTHPYQIVGRRCPGEHPAHSGYAPEARLAHQRHRLEPTKDFLHPLAQPLADGVARVPGGATVDRTAAAPGGVLRHVRGDLLRSHVRTKSWVS